MATIQNFISNIDSYGGLARLNRFETIIISPFEANPDIQADRYTSFRVVALTIPGKNLRTTTNENIYGPTHEMAQGLTYAEEVTMSFYLSSEHYERKYFLNWIDMIVKPDNYNLEYYDNYKRDIDIYQLNRKDERTSGIKLIECYPKTLGPIEYTQDSGEFATIDISFSFKEHYMIDGGGRENDRRNIPRVTEV
jgi:hypothetical protein